MVHFGLRTKTKLGLLFFVGTAVLAWTSFKLSQINEYKSKRVRPSDLDNNTFPRYILKLIPVDKPKLQFQEDWTSYSNAHEQDYQDPDMGDIKKPNAISKEMKNVIKQFAETLVSCRGVSGLTVGVVKGDDHWTMPVGVRNKDNGRPVEEKTKFLIGSITKTFSAQLAALTIQDSKGRLTWGSLLSDLVGPGFVLVSEEFASRVTIRDILSHRSGLVSGNLAVRALLPSNLTRRDIVRLSGHIPRNAPVGKTFLYSNMAYTLLAAALEQWWQRPWEELIKEKIFQPLGMDTADVLQDGRSMTADDFAKPYVPVDGQIKDCDPHAYELGPMAVTGNIVASAVDMIKWMKFLLSGGKGTDQYFLEPEMLSEMWKPQIQLSENFKARTEKKRSNGWPEEDLNNGYGMGWFLNNYRGLTNYWHGGGLYSYYSLVWLLPGVNAGIFISISGYKGCSNNTKSQHSGTTISCACGSNGFSIVESLAYFITDILLQEHQWIDGSTACSYPYPWVKCSKRNKMKIAKKEVPNLHLTSYTGEYFNVILGKVYIWEQSSQLHFQLRNLTGLLRFHSIDGHRKITFGLECTGRYRFISKPDSVPHIAAKFAFFLIFNTNLYDYSESISIHYSMEEAPFLFNKVPDKSKNNKIPY